MPSRYALSMLAVGAAGALAWLGAFLSTDSRANDWPLWVLLCCGIGLAGLWLVHLTRAAQSDEELAPSEPSYRAMVESLNDGLATVNENGILTYVNPRVSEMLGFSQDELLGRSLEGFIDTDGRLLDEARRSALRGGADVRDEVDVRTKQGARISVLVSARPIFDQAGTFRGFFALVTNITAREQAEEALRQANDELQAIFNAYPDLMFRLAPDGTVLDYRKAAATLLYEPPRGLLGNRVQDNVPPSQRERMMDALSKVKQTGRVVTVEYRLPIAGREAELEGRFCPLPNGEILLLVRNITRRKQTEQALAASETRYRTLVESINEGVGVMDEHGRVTYANPRYCQMLGFSVEEMNGRPADDFYDEQSRQRFLASREERQRGIPGSYELVLRTKSGAPLTVLVSEQPVIDEAGVYRGSIGVITEITQFKQVEQALRQANAELEAMFDAYPDMSFRLAADGSVADFRAGPSARAQMVLSPAAFIGKPAWALLPSPGGERLGEGIERVRATGSLVTIEYPMINAEGGVAEREARLSPLPNGEILVVVRDITERKFAEERLNALSLRLLTAQEDERQYIARELHDEFGQALAVSKFEAHELHARLTAEQHALGEVAGRLYQTIERSIETVRTIQHGLYPTILDHLGLSDAIETLVEEFQQRTGVACMLDMDAEPIEMEAARQRALYRIVQEALTNAVRHSGATQVEIGMHRHGCRLRLEICDDGRGIDAAQIGAPDSYGLMGMRKRAELCRGSFEIQGEPGEGTTITVEVPFELPA